MDIISQVLRAGTAENCSLQISKFLIRKPIGDHFVEIYCKFQSTFKKFGQKFFNSVVNCNLLSYCKPATPVKRGLLETSRRAAFWNIPGTC